ncbi:hypothetical protein PILCRDRAFT_4079 [Piloderma croceum F 1598]|uniref:Uncharacterized protein n=1 Tax=Piloderma croceum (strain F 1598) TaxID=765440 RepID=A0A0C3CD94_PILCF|nr:hypothetical protein PILCRDRAFT_4079 [Piloderma croceum F 1598]
MYTNLSLTHLHRTNNASPCSSHIILVLAPTHIVRHPVTLVPNACHLLHIRSTSSQTRSHSPRYPTLPAAALDAYLHLITQSQRHGTMNQIDPESHINVRVAIVDSFEPKQSLLQLDPRTQKRLSTDYDPKRETSEFVVDGVTSPSAYAAQLGVVFLELGDYLA